MTRRLLAAVGTLVLSFAGGGSGQDRISPPLPVSVAEYTLRNGLRVIVSENPSLPLVSVVVGYGVGSLHEPPGKAGLAYLMENLMFQGSDNVSPMQHLNSIVRAGGMPNAVTHHDRTLFYQTVPSNQLPVVLWLESDRMLAPSITGTTLERVREDLIAEVRQAKSSQAYFDSMAQFDQLVYGDPARGHPLSGTEESLRAITLEDVRAFHDTYYVPNNAVLCVAGNVRAAEARELAARYFETIPRGAEPPAGPPAPPAPEGMVTRVLDDALATAPGFQAGYRLADFRAKDVYAFHILDYLLLRGNNARLRRRLLRKDHTALYLTGGAETRGDCRVFRIFATTNNELMSERSWKSFQDEIGRLKSEMVGNEELARAKVLFRTDYLNRLSSSLDRAIYLAETRLAGGDPAGLAKELDDHMRVTPNALYGLVTRNFRDEALTVLTIRVK